MNISSGTERHSSKRRRGRIIAAIVRSAGALALGTAGLLAARSTLSSVPTSGPIIFASWSCPYSRDLASQVSSDTELAGDIIVLPADAASRPSWTEEHCDTARAHLTGLAFAVDAVIPRGLSCSWLADGATNFHSEHFVYTPAWADEGTPVSMSDRDKMLDSHSYTLDPTNELRPSGRAPSRTRRPRQKEPGPDNDDPMQWGVGHTVGY